KSFSEGAFQKELFRRSFAEELLKKRAFAEKLKSVCRNCLLWQKQKKILFANVYFKSSFS
ncbi:hypothetical protein PSY31_22095, partial [Shigella flexneri]|nr:hypothetical protein [Shigella flexneri]